MQTKMIAVGQQYAVSPYGNPKRSETYRQMRLTRAVVTAVTAAGIEVDLFDSAAATEPYQHRSLRPVQVILPWAEYAAMQEDKREYADNRATANNNALARLRALTGGGDALLGLGTARVDLDGNVYVPSRRMSAVDVLAVVEAALANAQVTA